ncbi:HSP20-like chaperone [Mycena crocata]|nr:HSP20-like chaperone [Mycena crocata]
MPYSVPGKSNHLLPRANFQRLAPLRMDIYADPDSPNIIATFELPGVKTSDVSISVNKETLIIQGERLNRYRSNPRHPSLRGVLQGNANEKSSARFSPYRELRYGHFHRKLRLPSDAEVSGITATLADGLLTVSWPRSPLHQQVEHAGHPTSSVRSEPVSN